MKHGEHVMDLPVQDDFGRPFKRLDYSPPEKATIDYMAEVEALTLSMDD